MVRLLVLFGLLLCASWPPGDSATPSPKVKKIFIGVDGLSREEFDHAQKALGLFSSLRFVKTHVSTFPSISDYAWNVMVHSREVFGNRGRIKNYEAAHYDRDRNELVSDPREYFRRLGEDQHYFSGAFSHWLNPFVESLLYIPTEELPKLELKQLLASVKADPRDLVTVMVASSDALAHTRADGSKFLVDLDQFVTDLETHFRELKTPVEIILASDHGQASRFLPGENPRPLVGVDLSPVIKRSGLRPARKLESDNDVVIPLMALANYGTVYLKDPGRRSDLVREIRRENWFSLGIYREEVSSDRLRLIVFDRKTQATLTVRRDKDFTYLYEVHSGDPLGLSPKAQGRWLSEQEARDLTRGGNYPDAFHRLAFSAFETEADFPDLLFTLGDEYYLAGELDSFTSMFQTHGSLGRRSSSGILASTEPLRTELPELRTEEILGAAGITPKEIFASTQRPTPPAPAGLVATGSEAWDNRRVFSLMNRIVQDSRYVFEEKSFEVVKSVVRPLLNERRPKTAPWQWKETLSLHDVAGLLDLMIRNGNLDKVKTDPRFQRLQSQLALVSEKNSRRSPSAEGKNWPPEDLVARADAAKKIAMKSYSSLFFLEKALTLPEVPFLPDDRRGPSSGLRPDEVFADIFRERTLLEEIFPMPLALHWETALPPANLTFLYVPGIYNSLFDDEIFRKGLDRLKHRWGVRIITAPVFSTCSSTVNGKIILDTLKNDRAREISHGHSAPEYFVLGYSKGGVDALHAFSQDPEFAREHVQGLLTIASPIRGSSIINKTDLPREVMQLLGAEKAPEICRSEEKAARSIGPAAAQSFLRKKSPLLIGLTRYFSLSFVAEARDAHLFMRATKSIARFNEPNDGVVALSASRFPDEFGATDFGTVKADHLSGIVASHFPQEAFLESVLFTLGHLDAFNRRENLRRNERLAYEAKATDPQRHLRVLKEKIGHLTRGPFSGAETDGLSRKIQRALASTPYALRPFSLERRNGALYLEYSRGLLQHLFGGTEVKLDTEEELLRILLSQRQVSGKDLLKGQRLVVPESHRQPANLPPNELPYESDLRLNLRELGDFIGGKRVTPVTRASHPEGISFIYDHASSADFRSEYQWSFEDSAPPEADDHPSSGWETVLRGDGVWAKLASQNSSIRLTTYSWRFLAADFPELELEIQVNDDVDGANVLFGGDGKDDSAFQLWFTFRIIDDGKGREYLRGDEKMMTIGYYFGDEISGAKLEVNQIYKNYYSEKDFVVAKLPAARQKLIGIGKDMLGKPLLTHHDLLEDIRRSYPEVDVSRAEVVAITIQHDSNDTGGNSEALFRSLRVKPRLHRTVKAD